MEFLSYAKANHNHAMQSTLYSVCAVAKKRSETVASAVIEIKTL